MNAQNSDKDKINNGKNVASVTPGVPKITESSKKIYFIQLNVILK